MPPTVEVTEQIDEDAVAAYLARHPDFFARHAGLLSEIELVHETGQAVSLIERQVASLREQGRRYRQQLRELMAIAEQNDRLAARFRALSLGLFDCRRAEEALALLEHSLRQDFAADASTLLLRGEARRLDWTLPAEAIMTVLSETEHGLPALPTALLQGEAVCGRFNEQIMTHLFAAEASQLASAALIPVTPPEDDQGEALALLAIGSHDPARFTAGMGTVYLDYLGALLGRLLSGGIGPLNAA